ncbi:hypothetical protein DSECCO2_351580 [anaerobic digester metagenome]
MKNGGVRVIKLNVAGDADRTGPSEVGCQQLRIVRGKLIENNVRVRRSPQNDTVHRLAAALPVWVSGKRGITAAGDKEIGTGSHGDSVRRTGFHDGNIQQSRKSCAGGGKSNGYRTVSRGDGSHIAQACAIPSRGLGAPQCGSHIGRREGGAVGKKGTGSKSEGINGSGGIGGIRGTEQRLGRKGFIQLEKPLAQERRHGLLHAVGTGDGVQTQFRIVGQSQFLRQDGGLLGRCGLGG